MRRAFVWVMLWVLATGAAAAADLIPAPPWFEQAYWDQLVFGCAEQPDLCRPNNPNGRTVPTTDRVSRMDIHLVSETDPPLPQRWEDAYRRVIPFLMTEFAGGRRWSGSLTTGSEPLERPGVIDIVFLPDVCASGGFWGGGGDWVRGIVRLSMRQDQGPPDWCLRTVLLAHELGHVTGLQHVDDPDDFMCTDPTSRTGRCDGHAWSQPFDGQPVFSERQRLHIGLARQVADAEGGWFNWPGVELDAASDPDAAPGELRDGVKDLVDEALEDLQDDSGKRQATETVPALPTAGLLLLATLLALLGRRRLHSR